MVFLFLYLPNNYGYGFSFVIYIDCESFPILNPLKEQTPWTTQGITAPINWQAVPRVRTTKALDGARMQALSEENNHPYH